MRQRPFDRSLGAETHRECVLDRLMTTLADVNIVPDPTREVTDASERPPTGQEIER